MLNVMPQFDPAQTLAINQELAIPMPYPAPPGAVPLGPNNPGEPDDIADVPHPARKTDRHLAPRVAADSKWVAPSGGGVTLRHDAMYRVPAPASADAAR
jgi:hypothetical protein